MCNILPESIPHRKTVVAGQKMVPRIVCGHKFFDILPLSCLQRIPKGKTGGMHIPFSVCVFLKGIPLRVIVIVIIAFWKHTETDLIKGRFCKRVHGLIDQLLRLVHQGIHCRTDSALAHCRTTAGANGSPFLRFHAADVSL